MNNDDKEGKSFEAGESHFIRTFMPILEKIKGTFPARSVSVLIIFTINSGSDC